MKFRLIHTEVSRLRLDKVEIVEENVKGQGNNNHSFDLSLNVFADPNRREMFGVLFKVKMVQYEEFRLELLFIAWFESPTLLEKEQIDSPFARINAPAIAFPYLRSFISLLTLNAGFKPAILSTVNFLEMYEEFVAKKDKKQ